MTNNHQEDVASVSDIKAGNMLKVKAFEKTVLLANDQGVIYAVSDTCSHEDASLALGALKDGTVSCPLHGSRFCLRTGAALDEPAELSIVVYNVNVNNGRILLSKTDS